MKKATKMFELKTETLNTKMNIFDQYNRKNKNIIANIQQ